MFSLAQRFQVVSNKAMSWSLVTMAFVIVTSWIQLLHDNVFSLDSSIANIMPTVRVRSSRYFGSSNGKPKENVRLEFDLDADLAPLFNWNTKQVFVYLTAEYNEPDGLGGNVVTFWDHIIQDKAKSKVTLRAAKSKYSVWDATDRLSEKELSFKLHWNIQPWVGPLAYGETAGEHVITIQRPEEGHAKSNKTKKARRHANQRAKNA
ncbi:ABR224Wp [Eremothecium gossypii ATCC 10895]|uniref:Signal peptidase subunit 3 n=1 Tax=Eremothecium gossypii (strain ATCC 10895 / CBS 109.51 / FGSC 9923 / NRRL Y-1056) TaxID=284811 RepID=Q75CZ8_EREGS|nr:ABR224Wp [Eremothecium gossypii ATCC 10895]AAS50997.2 ABR224Wp [Eremothecium gossypii ATCC 10895]AEY95286.1 FABR224Wp [Eremothecium gossypii FDAG1]